MNLTTQQLVSQFRLTSPNQIPAFQQILREIVVVSLKFIHRILLLYPVNIILLFLVLYALIHRIFSAFSKPKILVYWPNQHIEAHDQHIKNLKKDIREIQNESLNLNRKMEAKAAENTQKFDGIQNGSGQQTSNPLANEVRELVQERQYIKEVSKDFITQIAASQAQILQKIKKYRGK